MREAYIYDAVRTPRGRGKPDGALYEVPPIQLVVQLLHALRERNNLDTNLVEDIILGCLTQINEQASDIAKLAGQTAGYPVNVPGVTLDRFCASGLESVNMAAAYVMSGQIDLIIAGGVESMSRARLGANGGSWYTEPAVAYPGHYIPQGVAADLIATLYGYSRKDVDEYAVLSHQRAAAAQRAGKYNKSIVPVKDVNGFTILDHDELVRPETTVEGLAKLKPAFEAVGKAGFDKVALQRYPELDEIHHVHHAGNSSGLADGAALVMIGSAQIAEKTGLKPRAKIRSFAVVGSEPTIMLTGPVPSSRKALERAGLSVENIDLFEVNEAFAAVVLYYMQEMNIPIEKVNVNGGAIALGHPIGATGAMTLGKLLDELEERNLQLGLCTLCVGGGMGITTIIERV
ncbi:MAG: acetyl-CoA C-acetyltransferase [Bacteroidia bacterium]|nr:acetyl-CoA C-acetyltransferase [Bacteroidia bacterium]MDW8158020.1 acetyl-CoA C-acetyltransferase [Bacteroidia bacterium]